MTPELKRRLFPLRAPRWQSLLFHPATVFAAAVDGYFEAFFACFPDRKPRLTFFTSLPNRLPEDIQ